VTVASWDSTHKSELCVAIWITREEANAADLRERLDQFWPKARESLLVRVESWVHEPQYETIMVPVITDGEAQ
jgi:hypothetical protein